MPIYNPTDWVDNVTPVNEANMDHLEGGVDANAAAIDAVDARVVVLEGRPVTPAVVNGSWIKGVGGAMVWSTIQAADVGGLTALLDAKVDDTEKGAANGVATLDSAQRGVQRHTVDKIYSVGEQEGFVPIVRSGITVWEAPPAGGASLTYLEDWSGATTYTDGDIVVYNGALYMCVEEGVTTPPENWGL
jgi:hypothetical protein